MCNKPETLNEILNEYDLRGLISCVPLTDGHINDTYLLGFDSNASNTFRVLQRINTDVFTDPDKLMQNYVAVTSYLKDKIIREGGDPDRETLTVFPSKTGASFIKDVNGDCWRLINYITDTMTCNSAEKPEICRNAGFAFGRFLKMLNEYPSETLFETIPDFHNTPKRLIDFEASVTADRSGRAKNVINEIRFVRERNCDCDRLTQLLRTGELPIRVTHNDTKLNNVLFDKTSGKGICVIDLDTVMPGSSLYDFGDSLRFAGNTAAEDEKDLSKVSFSVDTYRYFTEGYLSAAAESLTANEIANLPFSVKLMTLECGMRFLKDYIDGDVYFKVKYPEHNLVRCRSQFKLVEDIERKLPLLNKITDEIYHEMISK